MITFLPPAFAIFGMGGGEEIVILGVLLIFFGGDKMPELARGLGKIMKEIRKATSDVEREFRRVMDEAENPAATLYKAADRPPPPQAQPFSPPALAPEPSEDPRDAPAETPSPALPAPWPARQGEAPKEPPASSTHQFREDGPEFHSDI
jgi:sec-independent protein translocase protein TatA